MGVARNGKKITNRLRKLTLLPGDILLLLSQKEKTDHIVDWLNVLPLEDRGTQLTANRKTGVAIALFGTAIVLSSVGIVYLPIALGLVVVLYVLLGILEIDRLYHSIEWPVIVLLGSMIPLGTALETSGGTALLAELPCNLPRGNRIGCAADSYDHDNDSV